jgi:hypothetical protein
MASIRLIQPTASQDRVHSLREMPLAVENLQKSTGSQYWAGGSAMHASNGDQADGNRLFFGDNLEILRSAAIPDRSVDLIYLDPPFNGQAQYNVLFHSARDNASAQASAFLDTWQWGEETELSYREIMQTGGSTAKFIDALRSALGEGDLMAYLVMTAVRLDVLRDKLKSNGSLYLHCDCFDGLSRYCPRRYPDASNRGHRRLVSWQVAEIAAARASAVGCIFDCASACESRWPRGRSCTA